MTAPVAGGGGGAHTPLPYPYARYALPRASGRATRGAGVDPILFRVELALELFRLVETPRLFLQRADLLGSRPLTERGRTAAKT